MFSKFKKKEEEKKKPFYGHYSQEALDKSALIMTMEMCWLWNVIGFRSGKVSTLPSFLVTLLAEAQPGPVLMPAALGPSPAPPPPWAGQSS